MNPTQDPTFPFVDASLARRLEGAEARSNAEFIEAKAALRQGCGAEWIEVGGTRAMFDFAGSPLTQTFGLGVFEEATGDHLDELEAFYRERNSDVFHEVSPLAGARVFALMSRRGYHPIELSSVMYRPIQRDLRLDVKRNEQIEVRRIEAGEESLWARTSARGWSELSDHLEGFMLEVAEVCSLRPNAPLFVAQIGGETISAGTLILSDGVVHLGGACTIPEARRQGAQLALLEERLRYGTERGCDIALMGAEPGSASQRNAERHGFRIAYTRTKWQLRTSPE